MDERIEHLIEDVTSGLRDDPELRLDVRAELGTHLEQTARAFREEGKDEGESVAEAVKVFGAPADLAGELLDANKRRMKLRALARLAIRALLIPAAFVLAVWVGYWNYSRFNETKAMLGLMDELSTYIEHQKSGHPGSMDWHMVVHAIGDFIDPRHDGATSYNTTNLPVVSQCIDMPAITKAFPENKYYWAYYATRQLAKDGFEAIAAHGMQIDLDNALYHYLLAGGYLQAALELKVSTHPPYTHTWIVRDPALLEKGLHEVRLGMGKPYIRTYRIDVIRERLTKLPAPRNYMDYRTRIGLLDGELFYELARYRYIIDEVQAILNDETAQGHIEEARALLLFPQRISEQLARDPDSLIHLVAARLFAEIGAREPATLADRWGWHKEARQLRAWDTRFGKTALYYVGMEDGPPPPKKDSHPRFQPKMISDSGSVMANVFASPYLDPASINPADLAPTRELDYLMIERFSTGILLWLLTAVLLIVAFFWGCWYLAAGKARKSFILLLPTGKVVLQVFVYGMLLPLVVYYLYTRVPALSGRNYNVMVNEYRLLTEQALLILVLFTLPVWLSGRDIRRRCSRLGIPTPVRHTFNRSDLLKFMKLLPLPFKKIGNLLVARGWAILLLGISVWLAWLFINDKMAVWLIQLLVFVCALVACVIIVGFVWFVFSIAFKMKENAVYYGTLCRSLVAVYALAIILLTGITQPYFAYREVHLLAEDRLVFPHGNGSWLSPLQTMAIERIKGELFPETRK